MFLKKCASESGGLPVLSQVRVKVQGRKLDRFSGGSPNSSNSSLGSVASS
jgi:hypothetical protein